MSVPRVVRVPRTMKIVDIPIDREAARWVGMDLTLNRAPMLGEHNQYVLQEILGRTDEEFAMLLANEIVV